VFPEVLGCKDVWQLAESVYDLLRNGLFHEGCIKVGLAIAPQDVPIKEESGTVMVDPLRFLDAVETTFIAACNEIRTASEDSAIRQAFEAYWTQRESEHIKKWVSRATPDAVYPPVCESSTTLAAYCHPKPFLKKT
jgi:hypothetical protein